MQNKYFAASNSAYGFKNYFGEIFSGVDTVYVIKGGPGTGKSSFMKRCAKAACERGLEVEYYYCSSDANSLDGILISDGDHTLGMLDGTAPHVWEPKFAGAVDQIINLGTFWNRKLLSAQKNEIISLSSKKTAAYNKAYRYLRSCGNLRAVIDMLLRESVNTEKMRSAAERLTKEYQNAYGDKKAKVTPAITEAVTMRGQVSLDTFEKNAERIYRVGSVHGVGQLFLKEIYEQLLHKDIRIRLSYDAVCPWLINGMFIEDNKTAFVIDDSDEPTKAECVRDAESNKYINTKRFILADELRAARTEIRYAEKLSDGALEGALHALSEVNVYHFLLEDIYKNAMDFSALTSFTNDFINKLFD